MNVWETDQVAEAVPRTRKAEDRAEQHDGENQPTPPQCPNEDRRDVADAASEQPRVDDDPKHRNRE